MTDNEEQHAGQASQTRYKSSKTLAYINAKIDTAKGQRAGWEQQWGKNNAIYMGDHKNALEFTGMYFYAMMNLTAQVINTKVSFLNANPVRPVVVPRDNNEPVEWFLSKAGVVKMDRLQQMQAQFPDVAPEQVQSQLQQFQGPGPFTDEQVAEMSQWGFTEQDYVKLSDDLVSDAITQELVYEWIADTGDQWLACNNQDKIVIGQSDAIAQWNENENRIHFETLYPYDVFVDPVADNFSRANWVAVREVMTKAEAKGRWPDMKSDIEAMGDMTDAVDAPRGARYQRLANEKDLVVHWTLWERNAEIEVPEDEANEKGLVSAHPETGEAGVIDPETGEHEPLDEDGGNWPKKVGIRQLEIVGDMVIFDGESPFGGIPVDRNYNIRAVNSAYGIGDPQALGDLQDIVNRLLSQFAENIAQFRTPMLATPETVYSALESEFKRAFTVAGMKLPVPDNLWEANNGNIIKEISPPQIPQSAVQLWELIINQFYRLAGVPNALRGDTQSGTSGRALEISTSNAGEPIAQVARNSEMFLRKLLHTAVYLIVEYLPTEVFCERNKRFEPHVFEAIRNRVRRTGYDIDVQVSGTNRQDQEAQRLMAAAHNVPVLWQSPTFTEALLKKLGLPDASQIAKEVQMAQQPQMAPPQGAQQGVRPSGSGGDLTSQPATPSMMNKTGPRPGSGEAR